MMFIALLSTSIGIALGLLGGGGSILAVPVLTYAAGVSPKQAIAMSLLVVGTTATFALIPHAKRGNVEWRTGAIFAAAAMAGGFLGGTLASLFSGHVLLLAFAAMMVVTAIAMAKPKRDVEEPASQGDIALGMAIAEGLVVGTVTGLVGAGGGFLVVPALVILGKMPMHRAVGTSLMVIALKSFAAFAGHITHVSIDFKLVVIVTTAACVGSLIGGVIAARLNGNALRGAFAALVVVMAAFVVWREAGVIAGVATFAIASVGALWRRSATSA